MQEALLITLLIGVIAMVALQIALLRRKGGADSAAVEPRLESIERSVDRVDTSVRDEVARNRLEVNDTLRGFGDSMQKGLAGMSDLQQKQLGAFAAQVSQLSETNQQRHDALRAAVEDRLKALQEDNAKQIDQMRQTVDEKLQGTLEKRLGESFKQVSERLEQVYRGLGEMQTLAAGVGDLKKVLANVKTRGTWGEVQLGAMLEQVLSAEQYGRNVATKGERGRVEFAVKLPGRSDNPAEVVWLPIDAKFPVEDYQRLVEAQERADAAAAESSAKALEDRVRACAAEIADKYLNPPSTTDFGILFLPTEGLFAEVLRRPGLAEAIQRDSRVVIAGPTTLWALLSSLQMGFRTLAIEKRSSEVWTLLSAVKTEWTKYGAFLEKIHKKLQETSHSVEDAARVNRKIGRRLGEVQMLPAADACGVLGGDEPRDEGDGDGDG